VAKNIGDIFVALTQPRNEGPTIRLGAITSVIPNFLNLKVNLTSYCHTLSKYFSHSSLIQPSMSTKKPSLLLIKGCISGGQNVRSISYGMTQGSIERGAMRV